MRNALTLLLFFLLLASLVLSNPSREDFARRMTKELTAQAGFDCRSPSLSIEAHDCLSLEGEISQLTTRRDYWVASLFTLPNPARGSEIRVLGMSGQLLYLSPP